MIVSCSGPWGVDNSPVYTKIRLEFPRDYPEKATPIISLEKTMAMKSDILQKISSETQSVADAYLSRQRSSLEAILRYLLGEQSLEDSILWLKERSDHTDLDLSQDLALSSSDEDDEDADRYMNAQGQGMNMSDDMLATLNAGYNVPQPRTCGALWSDDGRLVCFFPSKDGKSQSLLDLSLKGSERSSRSHRILSEGFGRLYDRSLIPKKIAPALETIESNESDSESLSTSSSGSSSSSEISGIPCHHLISSIAWRGDISETQRAVSVDESQKSSGGTGITKILKPKSANFISIHNFTNLLPSRKMLALQYSLDRFDSFTQNAKIAAKNSDHDLADAWEFIDLILRKEIPLISTQHPYKDESILVAVRRTLPDINRRDSAIDLSYDARQDVKCSAKGSVKWGIHPFGRMLVQKL